MAVLDIIAARRSVRRYEQRAVEQEKLIKILEAGRLAPSTRNNQNWKYYVVERPELRRALVPACAGQEMVGQAPCVLVICGSMDRKMMCGQSTNTVDCSIALAYMMLVACELGLDTCWLGSFGEEEVKVVLGIPEELRVIAVTPLGYGAEHPEARPRKSLAEIVEFLK